MNKQLRALSRVILAMFLVLFFSVTMIQVVFADDLNANEHNQRTMKNSYNIERGSILVQGDPIAFSVATDDEYKFARQYTAGEMYAPVTGYYSRRQGMTGLEAAMNPELSGLSGAQAFTRFMRTLTGEKPQGNSVETTIDAAAQQAAFDAMAGFTGAAIALDASTGQILAMVSSPSYDPSVLSLNNDSEVIANYTALSTDPAKPLDNRAIAGDTYHPGSTYKLVTVSAAFESGAATPDTKLPNPPTLQLPGSSAVMSNAYGGNCGGGSEVTVSQALVLSCNVPMAELALTMNRDEVPKMASQYGFGKDLEIPLVVTPSVSPPPLDEAQAAIAAIGQLDVRATPIQMAMVSSAIVNDGVLMKPGLVQSIITPDLRTEGVFSPEEFSKPISEQTASQLQSIMQEGVESSIGLATRAKIDGARVGGKTGTAQNGTDASGKDLPYTLWFTGWAVMGDRKVAVAVAIEDGGGEAYAFDGSSSELPVVVGKQIMEAVLKQ